MSHWSNPQLAEKTLYNRQPTKHQTDLETSIAKVTTCVKMQIQLFASLDRDVLELRGFIFNTKLHKDLCWSPSLFLKSANVIADMRSCALPAALLDCYLLAVLLTNKHFLPENWTQLWISTRYWKRFKAMFTFMKKNNNSFSKMFKLSVFPPR